MVEFIKFICQLIDISAQLVRRRFRIHRVKYIIKFKDLEHQGFLTAVFSRAYLKPFHAPSVLLIFIQDGFYPHDSIKDVRSRVSFKGREPVHVKYIVL